MMLVWFNRRRLFFGLFCSVFVTGVMSGQVQLTGKIYDGAAGQNQPLFGANIYHVKSKMGTITDENGNFTLDVSVLPTQLVLSYVGFKTEIGRAHV